MTQGGTRDHGKGKDMRRMIYLNPNKYNTFLDLYYTKRPINDPVEYGMINNAI
jgi:hypothetical protein